METNYESEFVMDNEQKEFFGYTKNGVFVDRIIATEEQFNKTGLVAGVKPPLVVTSDMVNAEAKSRIYRVVKAKNEQDSNERQANLLAEYMEFQDILIDDGTLSPEQIERRLFIKKGNELLKAIVTSSNVLNSMDIIPTDYKDQKYWP